MDLTLIFILGDETYGLEIDAIQEIIEDPDLHFVPRAEGVVTGAINFHGQIFAVIDLPGLLGFSDEERDHRYVVLTPDYKSLAISVSGIERIVKLDLSNLQPPPADASNSAIRGVADSEGLMINMLDADEVIKKLENIYSE